jgi:hypothetical protein
LLAIGGDALSSIEYRLALSLGASVAIVAGTNGAAGELVRDPLWSELPNLYELPFDAATARAFVTASDTEIDAGAQEQMARTLHARYVAGAAGRLPPGMRPWERLPETFRRANFAQAQYCVEILRSAGFDVRKFDGRPPVVPEFTGAEVEQMAVLEHGRWNVERLREGWRYGKQRDDARRIHDCLVSWEDLPDDIRQYDREAVRTFPEILARAGLEIVRAG